MDDSVVAHRSDLRDIPRAGRLRFLRRQTGQGSGEYALLLGFVALFVVAALLVGGGAIFNTLTDVGNALGGAGQRIRVVAPADTGGGYTGGRRGTLFDYATMSPSPSPR